MHNEQKQSICDSLSKRWLCRDTFKPRNIPVSSQGIEEDYECDSVTREEILLHFK